jgi:hypothetical protein
MATKREYDNNEECNENQVNAGGPVARMTLNGGHTCWVATDPDVSIA